jgi:hypothetical protein
VAIREKFGLDTLPCRLFEEPRRIVLVGSRESWQLALTA